MHWCNSSDGQVALVLAANNSNKYSDFVYLF